MQHQDIAKLRLHNQRLIGPRSDRPEDVVGWLGAVQAQDYAGAKWGIAQRTIGVTNAGIDRLFDEGRILRTHAMRPTWHFLLPGDIRWIQKLTGPRVHLASGHYYRKLELDDALFARTGELLVAALDGGRHLTRTELADHFAEHGIIASGPRLAYLIMHAELNAIVCSGPLRGKQFTYGLVDERAPRTPALDRDEALAELTKRYFHSHGPATPHDFSWWSGLTVADAKKGVEMIAGGLEQVVVNGKRYWFAASSPPVPGFERPIVHLLPNYDEHIVAYRNHSLSFDPKTLDRLKPNDSALMAHIITLNGHVAGGWRRTVGKTHVTIHPSFLSPLAPSETDALRSAAQDLSRFLALPTQLSP